MVETVTPSRHVLTHAFLRKAMVENGVCRRASVGIVLLTQQMDGRG